MVIKKTPATISVFLFTSFLTSTSVFRTCHSYVSCASYLLKKSETCVTSVFGLLFKLHEEIFFSSNFYLILWFVVIILGVYKKKIL